MYRLLTCTLLAASINVAATGATGATGFVPGTVKVPAGQSNEVLVLGTPHLSYLPKTFDPANLDVLIGQLSSWKPNAIAIEALSGLQCSYLKAYPKRFSEVASFYCWDSSVANKSTGLDVTAATAKAEEMLAGWPASPSAAQRRTLASLFLAAGEPASALVQWLRLPAGERRTGDGLDEALVKVLDTLRQKRNENYLIAAPLAVRAGLERVYGMDDQTAYRAIGDEEAYNNAIRKAWKNDASAERKRQVAGYESRLDAPAGVVALYKLYNTPGMAELTFRGDFGAALNDPSPQRFGRGYVGNWETRNLRMAANIREVSNVQPGSRTLVIVGAAHKAYLEAYLDQMHDMRVISLEQVLN